MRVLLTGGSGFVGGHVARVLAAEGHDLRLLVRPTSNTSFVDDLRFERVVGDLRQPETLHSACEGVDAVVHAAAVLRAVQQGDFMRANRAGTKGLAEAAANAGVERFVYVSSIAARGPAPGLEPESPETPLHPVSAYGRSKAAGEEALLEHRGQFSITIIRPPAVYGPADTGLQAFFWMAQRGFCVRLEDGSNLIDVVYGPDLAEAVGAVLRSPPRELAQYEPRSEEGPFSWNDMLTGLGQVAGRNLWIPSLPGGAFHGFARCLEYWSAVSNGVPLLDRTRVIEMRQRAWICDASSLTADTGWRARTPLAVGLKQTMAWYVEHGLA